MQKHSKIRNVPFPRPCGATGILRENFMHWHFVVRCSYMKFYEVSCHLPENPSKRDTVHSIAHRIPFVSNFIGSYRYRSSFCQRASPFCFSSVRKARRPSLCSSRRS